MKTLFGVSLLLIAQLPLIAVEVGNTFEQVEIEKGVPPGKMGAGGFVILAYPDMTIRLVNNRVVKISGPPRRLSVVPTPKPKPKPKPVVTWISDVDEALAQAHDKNRRVLLFPTGWGSRSDHLEANVLATPEFIQYAQDNLVLLKMNFPKASRTSSSADSGENPASVPSTPSAAPASTPAATLPSPTPAPASSATSTASPPAAVAATTPAAKDAVGEDYPMVFILDSEGRPIGSLGYPDGGPNAFIDALKKL